MKNVFLLLFLVVQVQSMKALPFSWGKMLNAKSFAGESKPRAIKYNGGFIYVYGSFKDTIDLDPGAGNKYVNSYNSYSASGYLAKYDLNGNLVWGGSLKGIKTGNPNCINPPYNEIMDMSFDENNNIYITGFYDDSVRFEFGGTVKGLKCPCGISEFVVKLHPGGDVLAADHVTGMQCPTYFSGSSITLDPYNSLYTLTDFYGTGDFDFSAGTKIYDHQVYSKFNLVVSRYNRSNMALQWSGMLSSTRNLYGENILVDNNKNMYVCGKFTGTMDIDFTPNVNNLVNPDSAFFDYFIIKYDSNGNFVWVNQLMHGGSFDFDVDMDHNGQILLACNFKDYVDIRHNNVSLAVANSNGNASDLLCVKMDQNGNLLWWKRMGGTYAEYYQGMAIDANNQILLNGWFNLATSLDPNSITNDYTAAAMTTNGMMTCLSSSGNFVFGGISNAHANANNNGMGGLTYTTAVWDPAGNLYMAGDNLWQSDCDPDINPNAVGMINNTNDHFNSFIMKLGNSTPNAIAVQNKSIEVICYPSPASVNCILQSNEDELDRVEIFNTMGVCVYRAAPGLKKVNISLESFSNGIYFVRYTAGENTGTLSLLVSK